MTSTTIDETTTKEPKHRIKRVFMKESRYDGWYARTWVRGVSLTIGISAAVGGVAGGIGGIVNYAEMRNCNKFAEHSGYTTEWAYYGFWNHECFALMPDGTRVPTDKIIFNKGT